MNFKSLCDDFAGILRAELSVSKDVCVVSKIRNINVSILERDSKSPLVLPQMFTFENLDEYGRALNLGETVVLQNEITPFIDKLRENNINVTAIHNRWLSDEPRIFYINFESVEPPLNFAKKVVDALDVLQ